MVLYLCVQADDFGVCLELDFLVVVEVRLSQEQILRCLGQLLAQKGPVVGAGRLLC